MINRSILIVTHSFYPQNSPRSFRATELAKEFSRQGHKVTVLTIKNEKIHREFEIVNKLEIKDLGKRKWVSPSFGNTKLGTLFTRAFYRLLSLSLEYPDIELMFMVRKALRKEMNYDLLISNAVPYPVHWGVAAARKKNHQISKVWVADCGDPYMGERTDSFRKWFYFSKVEKWFMRKTDYISIPVETAKDGYYPEFHHKLKIIPQGFKFDPIQGSKNYVSNGIPTFAYAGGFIPGLRDPRQFMDYLSNVDIQFKFIVYTNTPALIDEYKVKLYGKLDVREYIPREDLLKTLNEMDFLVNFDNNTSVQVPSKLIDYALTGRPILNIRSPLEPAAIDQFLKGDYSAKYVVDDIQKYNIENVVRQFLELL